MRDSPRILILLPHFNTEFHGGGQQIFHSLLSWPDVCLLAGKVDGAVEGGSHIEEIPGGFRVKRRRRRDSSIYHFDSYWGPPRVMLYVARARADVIVVREFSYMTIYALLVGRVSGSRVVIMVESDRTWLGVQDSSSAYNKLKRIVMRRMAKAAHLVIAHDAGAVRFLSQDLKVSGDKVTCQPWIVLGDSMMRKIDSLSMGPNHGGDPPVLLTVAQLIPRKGIDLLVEAFAHVRAQRDAFLWIVGSGPNEVELKRLAESLGVSAAARFLGRRKPSELATLLKKATLFVFPTRGDYIGVAALEAMAAGLPVLASNRTNLIPHYIEHGISGYVFDPNDGAQALARAIEDVLADRKQREIVATEGQRRVALLANPHEAASSIVAILNEIA